MKGPIAHRVVCLLTVCQLVACSSMKHADPATSSVEGDVYFLGPVPGARVILYHRDDTDHPVYEADTVTDEVGHYAFDGLTTTGDYLVVAELAGLSWTDPETGRPGAYADGAAVRAPVDHLDLLEERRVEVTPLTTLLVAAGDGLRESGAEFPRTDAHAAFNAWLTFDPVATPIGEPRSGDVAARRHRLLLESWSTLAAHAADQAGLQPGTALTAEDLLVALVDDILGPPPPRFDGRGASGPIVIRRGPGAYPLTDQVLRARYAEAVRGRLRSTRWADLHEGDIADLLHSLRCAPAAIFASCDDDGGRDRTPPSIEVVGPLPDREVAGVITIEVNAEDPETGIQTLTLSRIAGGDRPAIALEDEDDRPGIVSVTFDTRGFIGQQDLTFQADARNGDGTAAQLRFRYPLANLPSGQLSGYVVKGPARHVAVDASALRPDGSEVALGQALTDDEGAFSLPVHEWRGPIILRAHGVAGSELQTSGFRDEARGRMLSWDVNQILTTVVPDFDPASADDRPVIVGPLADLAWARAIGLAAQRGQEPVAAYRDSLDLLATHFGLDGADTILHVRPAPADQPVTPPPNQAARHLLALGCLSRLSLDFAHDLAPDAVDGFTTLDLLAAYREDVLLDPWFDGRRGDTPVLVARNGVTRPLGDGLRADLAGACARWLSQPDNPTGLPVGLVADQLQNMALDASGLFAQDLTPSPFDDGPPEVAVSVEAVADGAIDPSDIARGTPDVVAVHVSGTVRLGIEASDRAGVASLTVHGPDGQSERLEVADSEVAPNLTVSTHRSWSGRLNLSTVPDGPLQIGIVAVDVLGHRSANTLVLIVDNEPPQLRIVPPPNVHEWNGRWFTNAAHVEVPTDAEDATGVAATSVTLDGVNVAQGEPIRLDLPDEGIHRFVVNTVDPLGHTTSYARDIVVNRTPPQLEQLESSYADEGALGPDRQLATAPRIALNGPGPIILRKWQDHWAAGGDNVTSTRWHVAGFSFPGMGEAPPVQVHWSTRLGDGDWGPAYSVGGADPFAIELTSTSLGFDPVAAPPPPHTTARLRLWVDDIFGNSITKDTDFDIIAVPPPVEASDLGSLNDPRDDNSAISLDDSSLTQAFNQEGERLVLRRMRVQNPHSIPVRVNIIHPEHLTIDLASGVGMLGRTRDALQRQRIDRLGHPVAIPANIVSFEVQFQQIEPYEEPGCSLFRIQTENLQITDVLRPDGIYEQRAAIYYNFFNGCIDSPVPLEALQTSESSAIRLATNEPVAGEGDIFIIPPGESVTVVAVADPFEAPPEVAPLLAHPEATLEGFDDVHYVRDIQGEQVLARPVDGVLQDRMCTQCFDDEPGCTPVCEGLGPWLGYRVQAITDVRLRTWERWEDRQPWVVHTLSEHGDLDVVTAELPPLPTVRLQADVAHWGEE